MLIVQIYRLSVRLSVPTLKIATGRTIGLSKWIIDYSCLAQSLIQDFQKIYNDYYILGKLQSINISTKHIVRSIVMIAHTSLHII